MGAKVTLKPKESKTDKAYSFYMKYIKLPILHFWAKMWGKTKPI